MTHLKVICDFDYSPKLMPIAEILAWRDWSEREREAIDLVVRGELRRFSTSYNGVFCDLERAS